MCATSPAAAKPAQTNRLNLELKVYKGLESTLCSGCGHDRTQADRECSTRGRSRITNGRSGGRAGTEPVPACSDPHL